MAWFGFISSRFPAAPWYSIAAGLQQVARESASPPPGVRG